jgi:hypothetical protein
MGKIYSDLSNVEVNGNSEIGIRDSQNARINPATEETLSSVKTATDQLNFTDGKLDVNAVIPAPEGGATEVTLADLLLFQKRTENLLVLLLEEQQKTNKILKKIYNPE